MRDKYSTMSKVDSGLMKRIWFTVMMLVVYRFGSYIPLPGIDASALQELAQQNSSGILGMFNMLSGGSLARMSIFALAIMPYITASIVMQLLSVAYPALAAIKKEGESGRKKIIQYTRYLTVLLCLVQSYGVAIGLEALTTNTLRVVITQGWVFHVEAMLCLTTGTMMLMWLGERITSNGIGNGISLIIFVGIVSGLPGALISTFELGKTGAINISSLIFILSFVVGITLLIIFCERANRKVLISYPKRQVGNKMMGGESSHIPLKLNTAGVIPPIFASSVLLFPMTIANFNHGDNYWLEQIAAHLGHGRPLYMLLYAILVVFFAFFYTAIVFNTEDTADNLKKYGAVVPGYRPGKHTAEFLDYLLTRITCIGAAYIAFVCIVPEMLVSKFSVPFYLGGTSLLIVVNVVIDTMQQVQSYLFSNRYAGLLKKAQIKGGGRR